MNMQAATANMISALHAHPARWVLAITGGGASAVGELLSVPGGSRTLLEIVVPYHEQALADFLGYRPDAFCSPETSIALAHGALARARWLAPGQGAFGLGCTASLVSDRPKRGDHRVHVSTVGHGLLRTWSVTLIKGARDRQGEEHLAAGLILEAMAQRLNIPSPGLNLQPGEPIEVVSAQTEAWAALLINHGAILIEADGKFRLEATWNTQQPSVLVPGAFNPLHGAHMAIAAIAERLSEMPAAFELSVTNVDKPELCAEEVRRRLDQFVGVAPVWLTQAPRFMDKATLFPGAIFAVGADTAARLVDARYYDNDGQRLTQALDFIRRQGCRFLVAGRADSTGRHVGIEQISIPEAYGDLFRMIPAEDFRMDVSSSILRARGCSVK
jgi:hypothetical protein